MAFPISPAELAQSMESVNGKLFRWLPGFGLTDANHSTAPIADATSRGLSGLVRGATGVADQRTVVAKDAAEAYAARVVPAFGTDIIVCSNAAVVALSNSSTSAQTIFPAAHDLLTVEAATTYLMLGNFSFNTGATDHITSLTWTLTTATLTSIKYITDTISSAAATVAAPQRKRHEVATVSAVAATSTAVQTDITLQGILRVNAAGTINPQVTFSAGPTGTCETDADSYLMLIKLGSNTFSFVGPFA